MLRRALAICAMVVSCLLGAGAAEARLDIRVDLATQRMQVTTPDGEQFNWAVSSGRDGYRTIRGQFRPTRLEKKWYSRKYGGNMPNAIFFRGGFAIHGTGDVGRLGRPASHGCVRLHPANAARLFGLVQKHGKGATRIAIQGIAPDTGTRYAKAKPATVQKVAARAKARGGSSGATDWQTARNRVLERDTFFDPGAALGFQPVGPSPQWRLRR